MDVPHHFIVDNCLTASGEAGRSYDLLLEAYAGHFFPQSWTMHGCCTGPVLPGSYTDPKEGKLRTSLGRMTYGVWNEDAYQLYLDMETLNQLMDQVDPESLLAVIILEGNIVKNNMIHVNEELTQETLLKLNLMLNTFLQGLDLQEINASVMQKMRNESGGYSALISDILDVIATSLESEEVEAYTSGSTNIFKYPELNDSAKASTLLSALEEKKQLTELMYQEGDSERGIQVYIGDESPLEATKDCSVVTATYHIEEGVYGKIGIIGPRRMDYEKVVGTLKNLMSELDQIFKKDK